MTQVGRLADASSPPFGILLSNVLPLTATPASAETVATLVCRCTVLNSMLDNELAVWPLGLLTPSQEEYPGRSDRGTWHFDESKSRASRTA
jgi:hypothetical protein